MVADGAAMVEESVEKVIRFLSDFGKTYDGRKIRVNGGRNKRKR